MQLTTIKSLTSEIFSVRLETKFDSLEDGLIINFGDPSVDVGGDFNGDTAIFNTTMTVGLSITGDTSGATGVVFVDGVIRRTSVTDFTVLEGVNSSLNTITTLTNIDYTITSNTRNLKSQFPVTQTFDGETDTDAEPKGDLYADELKVRLDSEISVLRAKSDSFSSEVVDTLT